MLRVNLEGLKSKWNGLDNTKKKVVIGSSVLLLTGAIVGGTWLGLSTFESANEGNPSVKKVVEINNDSKRKAEQKKVELKKAEEAKKKAEETKKELDNKLKEAKTEEEKDKIKKEISETEKEIKKDAKIVDKAKEEVKKAERNNVAVAVSPVVEVVKKPVKEVKKVDESKPVTPSKPVEKPSTPVQPAKPVEKPVEKPVTPSKPAKPVAPSVVSTSKESKSENKDYVNFGYDTVYDSNKAKGTSGISKEGSKGYTTYNYTRTVTKYSDGSVKYSDWSVASKNVVAPVNGVKWVGTYEEPVKTGYINNDAARETAEAINKVRVANGLKALPYNLVGSIAEDAYKTSWSKYGLGHLGYPGECVAYWSKGEVTVRAWMMDAHRESILNEYAGSFSVGVYTDENGAHWTIFYLAE